MMPYPDRQTDTQTDRQTDRHTHTQIWRGCGGRQRHIETEREGRKEGKRWEERA